MATDTRLQSSHGGYTDGDLPALSRAWIFNGPKGWCLPPVLFTGYRQPETACKALPDVRRERYESRNRPKPPARADPGGGDGDCARARPDARQTRPRPPVSLHWPLRHVYAEHRTDRRRAP